MAAKKTVTVTEYTYDEEGYLLREVQTTTEGLDADSPSPGLRFGQWYQPPFPQLTYLTHNTSTTNL